jgi:hypothetical protein
MDLNCTITCQNAEECDEIKVMMFVFATLRRVVWWVLTDVSEQLTASIIRAKVMTLGSVSRAKIIIRNKLLSPK